MTISLYTSKTQLPPWYEQVLPGWRGILEDLHGVLFALYPEYEVLQVKEKFGGLRVYINHANMDDQTIERMESSIRFAESRAIKTCENCGTSAPEGPRLPRGREVGWYKTFCDMCRDGATGVSSYE